MAGTITADTLTHSTAGSITTDYVVDGSLKSWVTFNSSGTVAGSLNISSITDNSTGNFRSNYSNNFSDSDYAHTCAMWARFGGSKKSNQTTSTSVTQWYDHIGSAEESDNANVMYAGDLA